MSTLKTAKDALVASLFELSKAAEDAASATVDYFKNTTSEDALAVSLQNVLEASDAVTEAISKVSPKSGTTKKGKKSKAIDAAASVAAPIAAPASDVASAAAAVAAAGAASEENGVVVEEKKKRKKAERDPNAPKKPLTMYFAYSFHHRDLIREDRKKKELEPLSATEVTEIVKKQWESISDEEKNKWQRKYQAELKDYQVKKEAYNASKEAGKLPSAGATLPSQGSPKATIEEPVPATPSKKAADVPVPVLTPFKEPTEAKEPKEPKEPKESKKESKKRSKDSDESSSIKKEKKSKKSKKDKSEKAEKSDK